MQPVSILVCLFACILGGGALSVDDLGADS